jgi:hypothetical protein
VSTILAENFDGVTAPALPSGWTFGAGYATTASPSGGITPTSSPNVLTLPATGTGNHIYSFCNTADGNSGNITIQVNVNGTGSGHQAWGLLARSSTHSSPPIGVTCYWLVYDATNADLTFHKLISGSASVVGSPLSLSGVSLPEWYQVAWTLTGSSLSVTVQDLGTGDWLNSSGFWQAGAATALSTTDSSVSGSGYFGVSAEAVSGPVYFDDLLVTTGAGGVTLYAADLGAFAESALATGLGGDAGTSGQSSISAPMAAESGSGGDGGAILASLGGDGGSGDEASLESVFTSTFAYTSDAGAGDDGASIVALLSPDGSAESESFLAVVLWFGGDSGTGDGSSIAMVQAGIAYLAIDPVYGSESAPSPTDYDSDQTAIGVELSLSSRAGGDSGSHGALDSGTAAEAWSVATILIGADVGSLDSGFGSEAGRSWVVVTDTGYHVYENSGDGGPINYASPVATIVGLSNTEWESPRLSPGTWSFAVRAYNPYGEEQNVDVAVTIILDAYGRDVSNIPAPPITLAAVAIGAGKVRVEWAYPPTPRPQYPTGFHVYKGTGGVVNYASPAATVTASWTGLLAKSSATIPGLSDGVPYTFGVRAFNSFGEEANTRTVTATAKSVGPGPVQFLAISAIT